MGNWWDKLSNLFGAMASAEKGDFDTVRELLVERGQGKEAPDWETCQDWEGAGIHPEMD